MSTQGNRMRGALFGDQLRNFKDAIVYNGTYEITNGTIKPMEDRWRKNPAELSYQMGFGKNTIIQPMDTETGPVLPNYLAIGQLPRSSDPSEKFDVMGIVLFVEEKPSQALIGQARTINVAEVVLMDHSSQQPLTVSTWDDLANLASEALLVKAQSLEPVGFTALKVSTHKGFSMTTTMSTEVILSPTGSEWLL
ncbi:replication protein A 70 kDa DNA-binding subunit B-like [Silene latifolia]|uniref:replication protein A 70 kDa DNA-binding subunit B-like n=1 Tax=Silene latifolia TaxID=37657 RepID=UPI003D773DFD